VDKERVKEEKEKKLGETDNQWVRSGQTGLQRCGERPPAL
jgi:hypothetical protein